MISSLRSRFLLKEYIKNLIVEEDFGSLALSDAMVGPYGMHYGSGNDLYKVFIKPFVDVVDTAAGKTKEISQKGQTLVKVAFETLATSLIPVLQDSYGKIFENEKQQIDKIRKQYAEVYQSSWDAFNKNDVLVAAFMYRPDVFLTTQFVKRAPKATLKLLSVLSGGALDKVLDKFTKKDDKKKEKKTPKQVFGGMGGGGDFGGYFGESTLREENEQSESNPLEKLVSNKKVKQMLANSNIVQKMSGVGQALVRNTLKDVHAQASGVLGAKSLQDLQQKIGKKIPGTDELSKIPEQERVKAEQLLLSTVKKSMREFYVKNLEAQVKSAIDAGVPQEHPYVKDYLGVLSKIKAL